MNGNTVKKLEYFSPPPGEEWRLGLLQELLQVREDKAVVPGVSSEEVMDMIDEICCN